MSRLRPPVRAALKLILLAVVLVVFVRPIASNFRKALHDLRDVHVYLLVGGVLLQGFALIAYTNVTRAALGPIGRQLSVWHVLRIQMSTRALGGVVPGGAAAGPALGFRLLTQSGVPGRDAGFALGAAGMVSSVMLNVLLWIGLLVSIPMRGVHRLYLAAAVLGLVTIALFGLVVIGLIRGDHRIDRPILRLARLFRRNEATAAAVLRDLGIRLRMLTRDGPMLRRVAGWALLNWTIDAASLWVFVRAFGGTVQVDTLFVAFGIANILAAIPISPSGIGIVEWAYITTLVGFGMPLSIATLGVAAYRFGKVLLPLPIGGLLYLSLRFGPWSIERSRDRLDSGGALSPTASPAPRS